jgi:hypothetical protein
LDRKRESKNDDRIEGGADGTAVPTRERESIATLRGMDPRDQSPRAIRTSGSIGQPAQKLCRHHQGTAAVDGLGRSGA